LVEALVSAPLMTKKPSVLLMNGSLKKVGMKNSGNTYFPKEAGILKK
jgi:hypothetical protein